MSIIAIVSNIRHTGRDIAEQVAARLEYDLVGAELLQTAAQKYDTTVKKLSRALAGDRTLFNAVTHDYEKSIVFIKAAVADLLTGDSLVGYGRAAYLIPRNIGHVLRVGLVAEPSLRLAEATEKDGLSRKEAETRMARRDENLVRWVHEQLGTTPWDPGLFDLKIALPATSVSGAVDLICDAITQRALLPTDISVKAALDLQLATRVRLSLLENGHYHSDVEADGGKVIVTIRARRAPQGALGRTVHALRQESQQDAAGPIARAVEGVEEVEVRLASAPLPKKTLLVDDEAEYVTTLSERLGMRDIESDVVYDGQQALDALQAGEPEVMILDLKMPGMNGLEVLRRVKQDHPDIQVIVVTGHGSEADERTARELGAFDYLHKPVDISILAAKIDEASKARQASRPPEGATPPADDEE